MEYIEQALQSVTVGANGGTSTYYNSEGLRVPRVTEILSKMIHSDNLMYWANSLGLKGKRYKEVLNNAANYGTDAHSAIEHYLRENIISEDNTPFMGFLLWYKTITEVYNLPIEILYVEHRMACQWFGGTLDCLMRIGGKIYLIDFKTSNHVVYKYFLQLAAYRYMLRMVERIEIDGVIVLQLSKDEPGFNEYMLDFSIPNNLAFMEQCQTTFLSLVYAFYNVSMVEESYKELFNRRRNHEQGTIGGRSKNSKEDAA